VTLNRRTQPTDRAYVVGVTGGVASGKTTFVQQLVADGPARVIDADRVGHEVLEEPGVLLALVGAFGDDVLAADGSVVRSALGARAFASDETLQRLNAIVHPPLLARLEKTIAAIAGDAFEGMIVLDAALLVEWDKGAWCDRVVAVLAPPKAQVERLVRERGWSERKAHDLVARQLPNEARAAYADVVLWNDGTRERFEQDAQAASEALWAEARRALALRLPPATHSG
jgi:dephospho-CoA kinase